MMDRHIAAARGRAPAWEPARHDRVRRGLSAAATRQDRRKQVGTLVRSGTLGVALFALALRALGAPSSPGASSGSELATQSGPSISAAGQLAYDDGGLRADVMHD